MKKKILILATVLTVGLCGCGINVNNSIVDNPDSAVEWFEETGIKVKASTDKIYYIVKDSNGWLYYYNAPSGDLEKVLDAEGNPTKDTSIFMK